MMRRILLLISTLFATFSAYAQTEQWETYLDICHELRKDANPCEQVNIYHRMDSLFDGYIPIRLQEMNYMDAALQCGDTATFKRLAFRVVRWKGWNPMVFYYVDKYQFLKDCDWWPELDSIQRAVHSKKDYRYAETLHQMAQEDQSARRAFHNQSLTTAEEDSLSRRMHEVDLANVAKLKRLIDTLGFPTWERVCSYGSHDAWLIAQHAPMQYQYEFTRQFRQAVADTNADPYYLAYLEDRLRTWRGLPQLYGTQFMSNATNNKTVWNCPIADKKNVDYRREEMHLNLLEDYLDSYLQSETETGMLDKDNPIEEFDGDYVHYYYRGQSNSLAPADMQQGVTDAVAYFNDGEYCKAIHLFCHNLSDRYPFVRDLQRYLTCLLQSECAGHPQCYASHYEVLERMVLCGYEPDAWLASLPDTLTAPLLADYSNLRREYLRYLNHEDDAELTAALASRADFEALLRSGKNYHRYELGAWNHAYPSLQKMTDELTKGDCEEFFSLLWREVERGNIHAEDYASLYDRTQYRLHGKDWYGTLADRNKHITTFKPSKLLERRHVSCLPPIESHNR